MDIEKQMLDLIFDQGQQLEAWNQNVYQSYSSSESAMLLWKKLYDICSTWNLAHPPLIDLYHQHVQDSCVKDVKTWIGD